MSYDIVKKYVGHHFIDTHMMAFMEHISVTLCNEYPLIILNGILLVM